MPARLTTQKIVRMDAMLWFFFAAIVATIWFGGKILSCLSVFSAATAERFLAPPLSQLAEFVASAAFANWITSRWKVAKDCRKISRALRTSQAELAHVTRVMTMGDLAASIAHEVNQPLSAVVINGNTCLRWLAAEPPNLEKACETIRRIIRDGHHAIEVVSRIRALAIRAPLDKKRLDMNDAIQEVIALAQGELRRNQVALRMELEDVLPPVLGDRVQLQQVVLNLIMNGIDALKTVGDRPREVVVATQNGNPNHVQVIVRDSGIGLDAQSRERVFDAFYSTKHEGMGIGLSISRWIVSDHGGRLWFRENEGPGSSFQFTIPTFH